MTELLVSSSQMAPAPPVERVPGGIEVSRVLGRLDGPRSGPTLVLIGGLHGNEPAGVLAQQRIFATLAAGAGLDRGRLIGLAGNLAALSRNQRYLDYDLNRCWDPRRVRLLRRSAGEEVRAAEDRAAEDQELRAIDRELERLRSEAEGPVYLIDFHTTSGPKLPFATLDDNLPNRKLAFELPVPVVLGLEEELADTLSTYVESLGFITAGFEAGQHRDPGSVDRAEAAIWITLGACGLRRRRCEEVTRARRYLAGELVDEAGSVPHIVEVRYRHPISPGDWFRMDPGWTNFKPVRKGQVVALDRNGPVTAPKDGRMLMPLYQEQGAEGFFVVERVHGFWLRLSAAFRRLHVERVLHWLPGVERHPERADVFVVDRHTARWLARQLFHLLGFRRLGPRGERYLTMARRNHDPVGDG
ncbi:MAG: succinylglutamate desuccinylase/aspartoacylase family protein [Thermoanaerobaculia bacterium]